MTEEINFWTTRCEYGWMSNFYRAGLDIEGVHYPTVEHFYQSSKCTDTADWVAIRDAATPAEAKRLGQTASMRWDWERVKVRVMRKALRAKFSQNPALGRMLVATGDAVIHEDSPTDLFWGKLGKDMLGKLLMEVRDELSTNLGLRGGVL